MGEEQDPRRKPFPWWLVVVIGVGCLGAGIVVIGILAALILPALAEARARSKMVDCRNNLKQLGLYLNMYASRYGEDAHFPPAAELEFWETLWMVPDGRRSVCKRPVEDGLFLCRVYGTPQGRTSRALDYTHPDFEATDLFPGGVLGDRVRGDVPIGGDIVGMQPNHGGREINVLRFDGSAWMIDPGSPEAGEYGRATTGDRVP